MQEIEDLVASFDGRAVVYGRRLDTGEDLAVGEVDRRFPTGSAAKVLVLLAFVEAVAAGKIDPSQRTTVDATYRDARQGSGVCASSAPTSGPPCATAPP